MSDLRSVRSLGAGTVPWNDSQTKDRARARLERWMIAESTVLDASVSARTKPLSRVLALAAAVLVFAVASFSIAAYVRPMSAQASLRALSDTAAGLESVAPSGSFHYAKTNGQVQMTRTSLDGSEVWTAILPLTRETWIAADGSGRIHEEYGQPIFPSTQDENSWRASGAPVFVQSDVVDDRYAANELTFTDLSTLSTNTQTLSAAIEARQILPGPSGDVQTFDIISDLLREPSASPAVRGALFDVAAELDGVQSSGQMYDSMGRQGIAVSIEGDGLRREVIFDPRTSAELEERVSSTTDGAILEIVTYVDSGFVDSIDQSM